MRTREKEDGGVGGEREDKGGREEEKAESAGAGHREGKKSGDHWEYFRPYREGAMFLRRDS